MTRYIVEKGPVRVMFSSLRDASRFYEASPLVGIEGEEKGDRIVFKVRLADNILNHVLVISGINYTVGFPLELARGVDIETRAKLYSSGLREEWWFVAASVLGSEADNLDELLEVLADLEAVIHEGAEPSKVRLATLREELEKIVEAYPEFNATWDSFLEKRRKRLSRETFRLLEKALRNCYKHFYEMYWEGKDLYKKYWGKGRGEELRELSAKLKKAVDIMQPLKTLEDTVGWRFKADELKVFPVDVFRTGGGIFNTYPDRIVCRASPLAVLGIHLDIAHEAGHLLIHDWKIKYADKVRELAKDIEYSDAFRLAGAIEEHIVALIQFKVDLKYYGEKRITHGFMGNRVFNLADEAWREVEDRHGRLVFDEFIELLLEKLAVDKEAKQTLLKHVQIFTIEEQSIPLATHSLRIL